MTARATADVHPDSATVLRRQRDEFIGSVEGYYSNVMTKSTVMDPIDPADFTDECIGDLALLACTKSLLFFCGETVDMKSTKAALTLKDGEVGEYPTVAKVNWDLVTDGLGLSVGTGITSVAGRQLPRGSTSALVYTMLLAARHATLAAQEQETMGVALGVTRPFGLWLHVQRASGLGPGDHWKYRKLAPRDGDSRKVTQNREQRRRMGSAFTHFPELGRIGSSKKCRFFAIKAALERIGNGGESKAGRSAAIPRGSGCSEKVMAAFQESRGKHMYASLLDFVNDPLNSGFIMAEFADNVVVNLKGDNRYQEPGKPTQKKVTGRSSGSTVPALG
jgi:hypothetical protein